MPPGAQFMYETKIFIFSFPIASAVKQYFRDLNKPLMTHTLYVNFVESVKQDNEASRMEHLLGKKNY